MHAFQVHIMVTAGRGKLPAPSKEVAVGQQVNSTQGSSLTCFILRMKEQSNKETGSCAPSSQEARFPCRDQAEVHRQPCRGVSCIPILALLVSIYQGCTGGLETLLGQAQVGLLPSTNFLYSNFQSQSRLWDSEKATGLYGRTLVLQGGKGKRCAYTARLLSCTHVNSKHDSVTSQQAQGAKRAVKE